MSTTHVFTSAALNYIPKVRMLFNSLRHLHPEWKLHLALADRMPAGMDLSAEPFDTVLPAESLGIPEFTGWSFCHSIVELSTAIKPYALQHLLNLTDCARVLYFDPDMVAFSRLDDIIAALEESEIALTPHQTSPEADLAAVIDNEICSLKHGVYNLGFIGVRAGAVGRAFAKWWGDRIYHFCRADIPNGLFTDQRWIDLVPAFFPGVAVLRSGRHNLAPWNLTTRELSVDSAGNYFVDGEPLGFYHFTGFDSGAHRIMAAKNGRASADAVLRLVNWYDDATKNLARDPLAKVKWAYGSFTDGTTITRSQRLVYRERHDLQLAYADPYRAEGYLRWWRKHALTEYPRLHGSNVEAAQAEITRTLTAGFRGAHVLPQRSNARDLLAAALSDPRSGARLARRAWEVLRSEGFQGIQRRVKL